MSSTPDQIRTYLGTDEPLLAVYSATLAENSSWETVYIGITDRRLLYVSEGGRVVNIGYNSICAIQSHTRTTHTYRGNDYRLLLGVGSLVTAIGFVAVTALTSTLILPFLLLVTVGGVVSMEYVRRNADDIEWAVMTEYRRTVAGVLGAGTRRRIQRLQTRVGGLPGTDALFRFGSALTDRTELHTILLVGSVLVTVCGFVGMVFLAPSTLVILAVPVVVAGLALVEYAHRHRNDFEGFEIVRNHEREVSISTDDDRTVHIRSDSSVDLGRELSRLAFTNGL